ncbi:MAG TPA: hypothetical protein VGG29_11060 [Caulobacteraceae bacterium]|jgi:hypothetical protein
MAPKQRWIVGALLAPLWPPAFVLFLHVLASGGPLHQDHLGWGRSDGAVGVNVGLVGLLYVPILGVEVLCIAILKRLKRYNAPRLFVSLTTIFALFGLAFGAVIAASSGLYSGQSLWLFGAVVAAVAAIAATHGALLAMAFCLIAATPWDPWFTAGGLPRWAYRAAGLGQLAATIFMISTAALFVFLLATLPCGPTWTLCHVR